MRQAFHRRSAFWLSVTSLALALPLWACSVPVFRYALERWPSDPYQAVVFHRGALTEAQKAAVKLLTPEGLAGTLHANIAVRTVDLDQNPEPGLAALWKSSVAQTATGRFRPLQPGQPELPWLVVGRSAAKESDPLIWAGPLDDSSAREILDSPVRREIVRRLGKGESVVWVLREIGEPEKDDEAARVLQSRIEYLSSVLQLPKLDQKDLAGAAAGDNLRVAFSIIRLSPYDEAERAFGAMLLSSEPDLAELHEPMAFPIFGRGRVLYALAGKGINEQHIDQASSFLIGACSCEVKEQNPGTDLLVSADWDQLIRPTLSPAVETPARAALAVPGAGAISDLKSLGPPDAGPNGHAAVEVVSFQPVEKPAPRPAIFIVGGIAISTNALVIGGLVLGGLGAATFFLRRKS